MRSKNGRVQNWLCSGSSRDTRPRPVFPHPAPPTLSSGRPHPAASPRRSLTTAVSAGSSPSRAGSGAGLAFPGMGGPGDPLGAPARCVLPQPPLIGAQPLPAAAFPRTLPRCGAARPGTSRSGRVPGSKTPAAATSVCTKRRSACPATRQPPWGGGSAESTEHTGWKSSSRGTPPSLFPRYAVLALRGVTFSGSFGVGPLRGEWVGTRALVAHTQERDAAVTAAAGFWARSGPGRVLLP